MSNQVKSVSFISNFSNKEVTVSTEGNNTFKVGNKVFQCREYVLIHNYIGSDIESEVVTGQEVINLLLQIVPNLNTQASLQEILDMFESKVIVDRSANPGYYGNPSVATDMFGNECKDVPQYQAMKDNRISPIGIRRATKADVKFDGIKVQKDFVFCKSDLLGTDYATAVEFFKGSKVAVLADKQNVSYLTYGNGVSATFTALVDGNLHTVMPVADTSKTLKRFGSNSASYAVDKQAVHTNLKVRGLDGKLISYVGAPKMAVIAFDKQFNNGSGVALSNMGRIEHLVPKTLTNEVTIDELGKDLFLKLEGNNRDKKLESFRDGIIDFLATQNGTVIAPGKSIVMPLEGGVNLVLATNHNAFPVTVQQSHPETSLGKPTYRDQVRSVFVKVATVANEARFNLKGRNGLMKFMAHAKDVVLTSNGEVMEDWDLILSPETNKGALCTLAAFASRFIDLEAGKASNVIFDAATGKLEVDTNDFPSLCKELLGSHANTVEEAYKQYISTNTKTFTVKEVVAKEVVEKYKAFENDNVQFVEEDGVWYLSETFTGIFDYVFPLWEVSTPAECAGVGRIGVNEQAIASLYSKEILEGIKAKAEKSTVALKYFEVNNDGSLVHVDREFDITNSREDLVDYLAKGDNTANPKEALASIINDGKTGCNAIRIRCGQTVVDVPLALILRSNEWSSTGHATTGYAPIFDEDGEGKVSYSITGAFGMLIKALKTCGDEAVKEHLSNWQYHYKGFISSVREGKGAANYLKVGKSGHYKVVTDYAVPMTHTKGGTTYNLPEIWVSPDFWGLKGKAPEGQRRLDVKNGGIVITSRVPVPNAVACVVVVKEDLDLDPCVFMINPITWSEATLGDADGDYGYLTPTNQFRAHSYQKAEFFNKQVLSVAGHYRICSAHGSVSPVLDFIGSNGNVTAWTQDTADFKSKKTSQLQKIDNAISVNKFVETMENIHDHYKLAVGVTYKFQEFAVKATVDHFHNGESITKEMWTEVGRLVYVYEQNALGGWTPDNQSAIDALVSKIKAYAKDKSTAEFNFKSTAKVRGRLGASGSKNNAKHYIMWLCASVVKCEGFVKWGAALPACNLHVLVFALRSVTRNKSKYVNNQERTAKLAEYILTNDIKGSLFDTHIHAALRVRKPSVKKQGGLKIRTTEVTRTSKVGKPVLRK